MGRFVCVVGLGEMGERDRLDGSSGDQLAVSVHWPRIHLAESFHGDSQAHLNIGRDFQEVIHFDPFFLAF